MSAPGNSPPHLLVVQLNADLRSAQLDLLSARCATDRLRLRFSPEDLARYADRDLLRKAADSATALHEFCSSIEKAVHAADTNAGPNDLPPAP
jgi:hypothetical protein